MCEKIRACIEAMDRPFVVEDVCSAAPEPTTSAAVQRALDAMIAEGLLASKPLGEHQIYWRLCKPPAEPTNVVTPKASRPTLSSPASGARRPFSAPKRVETSCAVVASPLRSPSEPREEDLLAELRTVNEEISRFGSVDPSVLAAHITALHDYNEMKDAAEIALGHIATLEQLPTREIHARYGVTELV
eukprot:m.9667 g.9667  ORF g.9667 m.9667 type:complete len:188 (-) comp5452_c0_seq1:113-676(-)